MQQNKFRKVLIGTLFSTALISVGCSNDSKSDSPPPKAAAPQSTKKSDADKTTANNPDKPDKKDQAQNQSSAQSPAQVPVSNQAPFQAPAPTPAPPPPTFSPQERKAADDKKPAVTLEDKQLAKTPPPESTARNSTEISKVVEPRDETTTLLTLMLTSNHAPQIENARDRLVNEIYSDEGAAPVKIALIQASVAKLSNAGLYTDEPRGRIKSLQAKLKQRFDDNHYSDVLTKGAIFAATGFLVMGPVAASGAYRQIPEIGTKVKSGLVATRKAWRENVTDRIGNKWQDMKARVARRGAAVEDDVVGTAATAPFRSTEQVMKEHLDDLGVSTMDPAAINEIRAVESLEVPESIIFTDTPKSDLKFAVVDRWNGEDLGVNRRIVFRQDRLMRGESLETTFVSNPMPEEVASGLGARLALHEAEPPSRAFVHVINPETGVVSATRVTWQRFTEAIAATGAAYKPLVLSSQSLAVGATTAGAAGLGYWWGYDTGHLDGRTNNAMNLEAFLPAPGAPAMNVRVIQGPK